MTECEGPVIRVSLNRPEVHNAMDIQMIRDLSECFSILDRDKDIRLIVISSTGDNFSAGADLNWMRNGMDQTVVQLDEESNELARLFRLIWEADPIVIASVRGKVMGGANGLLAASDMVVAETTASFAFPEVKLGLVPATIAPYILRKAGFSRTTELMLTGRMFSAREAREAGLAQRICDQGLLKENTDKLIEELLSNGPEAMKGVKQLLRRLEKDIPSDQIQAYTSKLIAGFRVSDEGQEGMKAFFEKRNPNWHENH